MCRFFWDRNERGCMGEIKMIECECIENSEKFTKKRQRREEKTIRITIMAAPATEELKKQRKREEQQRTIW